MKAVEDDYFRGLLAASPKVGNGTLLFGLDYARIDGPWTLEENYNKRNGLLRYSQPLDQGGQFSVSAQAYDGKWRSTDQIPLRAVQSGEVDRFGNIDPTDGGASHRYSLSANWRAPLAGGTASA